MSEPAAVEPLAGRADLSQAAAPAGFGYALAQARVRTGLSIEQAAARIRLHPKQLQAIENEDLQSLPAPAYVNGFIRNYARELGIDSGPLIEDLNAKLKLRGLSADAPDLGAGGAMRAPVLDDRGWRLLVLAGIVIGLICAGLIGVWMLRSEVRAGDGAATRSSARSGTSQSEVAAPQVPTATPAEPAPTGAGTAAPEGEGGAAGAPAQGAGAAAPETPANAKGGAPRAAGAAGAPAAVAPSRPDAPPAATGTSRPADAKSDAAGNARIPVATLPPAAGAAGGMLVLRFSERSWVEVSRPDGRVLLSRNGEAGSMELVNSSAPLVLVIGRADAVNVEYRGQPVNLKPYVNSNGVARVMLADGDVTSGGRSSR